MTNRDKINSMTNEELSELFCTTMEKIQDKTKDDDWCCDICPVSELCKKKRNGFLAWLEKEAEG